MLGQLGWGEFGALVLLALFMFGPERLPSVAGDAGRALRRGRRWLHSLTAEVKQDLGPELGDLGADLRQLRPTMMAPQLWDEDEGPARAPNLH